MSPRSYLSSVGLLLVGIIVGTAPMLSAQDNASSPLHPDDAAAVQKALKLSGIDFKPADKVSRTFGPLSAELEKLGIERAGLGSWAVHQVDREPVFFSLVHDSQGRVLAIAGNGHWLPNATLVELAALPELRILSMDHNVRPDRGWDHPDFDGSAFSHFVGSKLTSVRIGHGFQDNGLKAVGSVRSLSELAVSHSRITEAGLGVLRGHPGLTSLQISEMGRFSPRALEVFSSLPNLTSMRFGEAYVTYADGLQFLAPCAGRLQQIDLRMCVVPADDLAKLKADHPAAQILTSTPEQIVKIHSFIANRILEKAGQPAGQALAEALIAAGKLEKSLQKTWGQQTATN